MPDSGPLISLSIVSHGQARLVSMLLDDLERARPRNFEVLLTINIPENTEAFEERPYPLTVLRNSSPRGFGANHNAAFAHARGTYFAVVNPDIRTDQLDLDRLIEPFNSPGVAAVAPAVQSEAGTLEDSVRRFPTFPRLLRRVVLRQRQPDYRWNTDPIEVDWVAGMFVVFPTMRFREVGGFDAKRFYMYMEDADICKRLRQRGWSVVLNPQVSVVHAARRASHRNFRHLRWHLVSALRFLSGV